MRVYDAERDDERMELPRPRSTEVRQDPLFGWQIDEQVLHVEGGLGDGGDPGGHDGEFAKPRVRELRRVVECGSSLFSQRL